MPFAADGSFSLSYTFGTATRADSQFPNKVGVALNDIAASLNLPDVLTNDAVKTLAVQFGDTTLASALIGSATGGNKGAGTLNAVAIYENNVRVQTTGALLAANNLSDILNAATARSNISAAAKAQTFALGGFITSPGTATFDIVGLAPAEFGGTLTKFTGILLSGSCTMTLNINGTAVTNGVLTATTTRSTVSPSAANVFAATDFVTVTSSLNSAPSQFFYTLAYTRTLA